MLEDLLEDNNFISSSEFIMNNIKNKLRHWAIYYEHNQFNNLENFYFCQMLYDKTREKSVAETPEELVRQNLVNFGDDH